MCVRMESSFEQTGNFPAVGEIDHFFLSFLLGSFLGLRCENWQLIAFSDRLLRIG